MNATRTILVDLRGAQFNGDRGVPAYLQSLTAELLRRQAGHRWLLLHDSARPLPGRAEELAAGGRWCTAAELARDDSLPIDAVLVGCFFLPDHRCGADYLWPDWLARRRPRQLGIVYDLVPLLFPDRYLRKPRAERQYHDALRLLRRSDRLFAISHAARRDTIRHAAVDPARVACIYGDIDHRKRRLMVEPAAATADVPGRHGLRRPYCVCIGGDDWRKNLPTAIRAFAGFRARHPEQQLAIVCKLGSERVAELQRLASSLGLPADAVVCTGFVSDADLVGLVRHAGLLLYPSLYEGLGLPVLEAHGCGTPVVGSNTSSVAELVLPELACDPEDAAALAAGMQRVIVDPATAERSRAFGRRLLDEELGWPRAADRVLEAISTRPSRRRGLVGPPDVAVAGVLPPARTGIASYTLRFMQGDRWRTCFYEAGAEPRLALQTGLRPGSRLRPVESLGTALLRGQHEAAIFVLGNSPHHAKVLDAIFRTRGTGVRRLAYLHEAGLESLFRGWPGLAGGTPIGGAEPPPADATRPEVPDWITRALAAKPDLAAGLMVLAERAELDGLIVNSRACRDLVRAALGPIADRWTIDVAFHPIAPQPSEADAVPRQATRRPEQGPLRVGSFGLAGDTKRFDLLVAAVRTLRRHRPVELVVAGWEAGRYCRRLGLDTAADLRILDAPDDHGLAVAMREVDVAVQLRSPTFGESSGMVSRLLAQGVPLVVTDAGSFAELPAELVSFVPADCSAGTLAAAVESAAAAEIAPGRRAELLAGWSPEAFARRIADILEAPAAAAAAQAVTGSRAGPEWPRTMIRTASS